MDPIKPRQPWLRLVLVRWLILLVILWLNPTPCPAMLEGPHIFPTVQPFRNIDTKRCATLDPSTTASLFSGGTSVQEYAEAGGGRTLTVEQVRGSDWGGGVGGILYSLRGGAPSFAHYDRRGDVTARTNNAGQITWQASYEAGGKRAVADFGSTQERQKANTKDEDPTGLLNEGMRYRDLETGVFITRDPAGFVDGPNLYAYVRQNPWSSFDPDGLSALDVWAGYGQGVGDLFGGLWHIARHPIDTAGGLYNAARHPIQTAKAVAQAASDSWEGDDAAKGRLLFNVASVFAPTAISKAGKIGEAGNVVSKASRIANASKLAEAAEVGEAAGAAAGLGRKVSQLMEELSGKCFPAGTFVSTPNGERTIESLQEGEQIYAFDFDRGEVVARTVLKTYKHFTYYWVDIKAGEETITATRGHRFWVESKQQWIAALELQPGMTVRLEDGRTAAIAAVAIRELEQPEATFNFEVEKEHNYFVGRSKVLVHNGGPDFIGAPDGQVFPVPKGATGPTPVINPAGKQTGVAFTGGTGGANGQVATMRMMDPTTAHGPIPAKPNGYIKYENAATPKPQPVDPYTGKTIPNSKAHFDIWPTKPGC